MNRDIQLMINIQKNWDSILQLKNNIDRKKSDIKFWRNELNDLIAEQNSMGTSIKKLKQEIMSNELELKEREVKIKSLTERKQNVHNERELKAVSSELDSVNISRDHLEEMTIKQMDELEGIESSYATLSDKVQDKKVLVEKDVAMLEGEINDLDSKIAAITVIYNELTAELPLSIKSKFLKLLQSKEAKAIAAIKDEICNCCNFKIPAHLSVEASKNDKICNCTNCGRFIYAL